MINFFVNWELWQQMTFVLACAIVVVFIAGLIKLWWLSRYLKKHTILDLEKRARQLEMQKSGLPAVKRVDIPFGVRAIQSGIEVDGIWISRPGTPIEVGPSSPSFASSSTLDTESKSKGKEKELATHLTTTVVEVEPTPEQSPQRSPALSFSERHGVEPNHARAYPPGAQSTYRPRGPSRRRTEITFDDDLDIGELSPLEHSTPRHQDVETYIPTNSFSSTESSSVSSQQRTMVDRSSTSSEEGINRASSRYVSHLRRSAMLNALDDAEQSAPNTEYFASPYAEQRRNPFETSSSAESQQVSRPPLAANRPTPRRSYSGGSHANVASRRVNPGFEILPAGTFGRPDSQTEVEEDRPRRHSHNKIQKKNRDRSSREGSESR
ncbi:hypothetical protein GGS26DRAFT_596825 [Hypomontagnella submonticulosa]|nr:hypothetical protein GGS26DRAFT_596825 [Hypomontagnella submonticulosa]